MFKNGIIFVLEMVHDLTIMSEQLTHTKIYGHGAVDVLKQAEIKAALIDGALNIVIGKDQVLVVTATNDGKLRFDIVSKEPIF